MQLNLDGYMITSIWLSLSFVYVLVHDGIDTYSLHDLVFATTGSWLSLISNISMTMAI